MRSGFRKSQGFSLTELLVVIVIIVVLAGMTIAALPGIQSRINRGAVETFLGELESGLSAYEIDYGNYPVNEPSSDDPGSRDTEGLEGAAVLYQHLSGDFDPLDGEVDEKGEIYVKNLDARSNENSKNKRSIPNPNGTGYVVVDSYNSPIRYLAHKPNTEDKKTKNPTYDIWSIVGTNPANASDFETQSKYITNWQRN